MRVLFADHIAKTVRFIMTIISIKLDHHIMNFFLCITDANNF
ncbi:unnamed protein product [Brassica rapa subsp. trilocularis]